MVISMTFTKQEDLFMPRRGENIRKRSDGRWEGRVKTVDEFSGQSKYHSIYAHSYSEIKSKLEKAKLMNNVDQQEAKPLTINDALKVWLEANEFRLKKSTMHKYEYLISNINIDSLFAFLKI